MVEALSFDLGAAGANILFFDDTQENITGAEAAGLQSPDDIREELEKHHDFSRFTNPNPFS